MVLQLLRQQCYGTVNCHICFLLLISEFGLSSRRNFAQQRQRQCRVLTVSWGMYCMPGMPPVLYRGTVSQVSMHCFYKRSEPGKHALCLQALLVGQQANSSGASQCAMHAVPHSGRRMRARGGGGVEGPHNTLTLPWRSAVERTPVQPVMVMTLGGGGGGGCSQPTAATAEAEASLVVWSFTCHSQLWRQSHSW
jgi:hypothetical protein